MHGFKVADLRQKNKKKQLGSKQTQLRDFTRIMVISDFGVCCIYQRSE
jgi:hypothetical protein